VITVLSCASTGSSAVLIGNMITEVATVSFEITYFTYSGRTGKVNVIQFKLALAVLCSASLQDKYKCKSVCVGAVAVSLSKKLYHIALVYQLYYREPGINWESSPPSCNINEYLVITGEANVNCPCFTQTRF